MWGRAEDDDVMKTGGGGGGGGGGGYVDTLITSTSSSTSTYTSSDTNSSTYPATSSTFTVPSDESSVRDCSPNYSHPRLLDIILISAQDLLQISKSMRTYAVAWIQRKQKQNSTVDEKGHTNQTWNDRFAFCLTDELMPSSSSSSSNHDDDVDAAAFTIEIYNLSWFKDVLVGTVRVPITDLITKDNNPRFVALQIRHPSGKFQGKLNMGVSLLHDDCDYDYDYDSTWTMNHQEKEQPNTDTTWGFESPDKGDQSMINGSELYSDIEPSASIVAAEIARKSFPPPSSPTQRSVKENEKEKVESSSIVEVMTMEEATAKGIIENSNESAHVRWRR